MSNPESSATRRRKGHRPCDMCRRKKRRCDGEEPCGHCVEREFHCTYEDRTAHRTTTSYVQSLGGRLTTVESLLQKSNIAPPAGPSNPTPSHKGPGVEIVTRAIRNLNNPFPPPHSDDLSFVEIADSLQALSLNNPGDRGFQGKSSQAMLVKAAVDLKSSHALAGGSIPLPTPWRTKPWEDDVVPAAPRYTFPPDDLIPRLVALYFEHINLFFPLLHRPTFERAVAAGTHRHDAGFGGTLLLVCALGARYADDTRVHLPTIVGADARSTAGWAYFDQVQLAGHPLRGQPTLYDLQSYCLAVEFLERTSGPRACWTLVGFGIRLGQDIGAHRTKAQMCPPTPAEELEKRAYWLLILFDTQFSSALGRSFAIHSSEFDLALPLRCDDAYWEAGAHGAAFAQPPDTPSRVDFLVCQLNLGKILSYALKILYSTNRSKALIGLHDTGWESKVVIEFDSALNLWFDAIPAHLRWDPTCADDVFFDQAAALHCSYYLAQILIHRPFIPAVRRAAGPAPFPSLAICNNAARACARVVETQQRRRPGHPLVFAHTAAFTSGIVLLLNIWGGHRTGAGADADLSDVHRCMGVLRAYKEHWPSAGHLLDTLEQLLKIHHAPPAPERAPRADAVHDPSPFAPSGEDEHGRDVDDAEPVAAWRVYVDVEPEMLNHDVGPGEAPARPPRLSPAPAAFAGVDSSAFSASAPFPFDPSAYFGAQPPQPDAAMYAALSPNTVAMWTAAPSAFEVSDWDLYLSSLADGMHGDQSGAIIAFCRGEVLFSALQATSSPARVDHGASPA
ncbi:fungal-specific transcription factor domain-containing protein [Mycena latifolia]|nr:fungal-specific transcription factor domain-containing protein [Mycena latifolia]